MARGKLSMKFIKDEKVRVSTYQKRKKGLTKKAQEFSILCDVETCVIIYGPKMNRSQPKLDIWPPNPVKVNNVINEFIQKPLDVRGRKCFNVFDFFALRQKKLDDEICKLRKANLQAKFSAWDDRINNFDINEICALLSRLDSSLEEVKMKMKMMTTTITKMENSTPDTTMGIQAPPPIYNAMNLVPTNGDSGFDQTYGYGYGYGYDPVSNSMLDGVVLNNHWGVPAYMYGSLMLPMSSSSSCFTSHQWGHEFYHDINSQYGSKSKKTMF